jgi:hypothetical protein
MSVDFVWSEVFELRPLVYPIGSPTTFLSFMLLSSLFSSRGAILLIAPWKGSEAAVAALFLRSAARAG